MLFVYLLIYFINKGCNNSLLLSEEVVVDRCAEGYKKVRVN